MQQLNQSIQDQLRDDKIIDRIRNGEKELYEILMRRNNQKLFRVIRSYLKEEHEIEDVMQNTYIKAYEKLHQFKKESQFSTWLIKIGINEALARIKQKSKMYFIDSGENGMELHHMLQIPDLQGLNPEKKIIQMEAKQYIEQAIDSLPIKYRTVYILKEIQGMRIDDIASCLTLTESNVKVRLHRAKNTLKEQLYDIAVNTEIFGFGHAKCDQLVERVMGILLL